MALRATKPNEDAPSQRRVRASALSRMGLRPTNRDEAKVGQALSPVQMWGRRSPLPTEASTVPPGFESP